MLTTMLSRERGVTVFFTTHYMEEADRVADKIAVIDHGKIVAEGSPAIVLMICSIAGFRTENFFLLPVAIGFMFLIALLGNSIGTAFGSVLDDIQGFQLIMNFLVTPLFFFSNALFPVEGLPAPLKLLVHLNPLSYGIDGLRGAFGRALLFDQAIDFVVLGGRHRNLARSGKLLILPNSTLKGPFTKWEPRPT
jgi:ABC-2 type transporter